MKRILQISGGILLVYSIAGILLHALAHVEGFGHNCKLLLFSFEDNHLAVFTLTAAISASLFFAAKTLSQKRIKNRA